MENWQTWSWASWEALGAVSTFLGMVVAGEEYFRKMWLCCLQLLNASCPGGVEVRKLLLSKIRKSVLLKLIQLSFHLEYRYSVFTNPGSVAG
jgi:hypothetical protein